jgi:hypothetical protein
MLQPDGNSIQLALLKRFDTSSNISQLARTDNVFLSLDDVRPPRTLQRATDHIPIRFNVSVHPPQVALHSLV